MNWQKLLSGRLIAVVMIIGTYSISMILLTKAFCSNKIEAETYVSILNGFVGIASVIVYGYFNKKDNNKSESESPEEDPKKELLND